MENNDPYEELEIYLKQINNEILEEFDKTSHVNINNSNNTTTTDDVNDITAVDRNCINESELPVLKSNTASLRRKCNGRVTSKQIEKTTNSEDWNSLDQFEKLVKSEMEFLTNHQKSNEPTSTNMSTKINHQPILKPEKHVSIPLQSFTNKTKCITNINNCQENQKPPSKSSSNSKSDDFNENTNDENVVVVLSSSAEPSQTSSSTTTTTDTKTSTANTTMTVKVKDGWSSDDSILKSIDEDNKSTSSTVSSSSAFEDSTNIYSEKSESSMSSINIVNHNNKLNESGKVKSRITETKLSPSCGDDSLEVLSSYDNDSGNDEFDEKGDRFASFSYSSSDGGDRKFRSNNNYNSLPLMRVKRHNVTANFNSMKRKHFNRSAIEQEPFHDDTKVINLSSPSPSCGSWSSDSNMLQQTFNSTKSSSVPILVKSDQFNEDFNKLTVLRNSRSQSDRYLCEIQAAEAMKWLREAGFPQYAQMYEDLQFPIDLSCVEKNVEKDHPFLQKDQLQALYRRLLVLNRSAAMRLDGQYNRNINKRREDSDEDVCALSENWQFQPEIRRWSRVGDMGLSPLSLNLPKSTEMGKTTSILAKASTSSRESTPEEFEIKVPHMKLVGGNYLSVPPAGVVQDTDISPVSNLKRSGSERLRDGAKNFLRRVESIKSRRKKKKNREGVVISGPMHLDIMQLNQKFQNMSTKDPKLCKSSTNSPIVMSPVGNSSTPLFLFADSKICPASEKHVAMFGQHLSPHSKPHPASRTSPLHFFTQKKHHHQQQQQQNEKPTTTADDSSSLCSELSQDSSNGSAEKKLLSPVGRYFYKTKRVDEASGTLSDSEAVKTSRQQKKSKSHKSQKSSTLTRGGGGSFNLGHDSNRQHRDSFKTRRIFRSRSAVRHNSTNDNDKKDVDVQQQQPKSGLVVQRWHSFRAQTSTKRDFADGEGVSLCKLSCGQIEKLRKLALVTLTGYMERYCPSHRTGWNWELPKFIKKIKTPDYKDKRVFGVPFSIILQKTGHTLPKGIQAALTWLKINALDQTGIFRKSGVKSRIAKLKASIDQTEEDIIKIFEDQQAYDVADVVKQYFRDLPESLLTTKLSETFVAIFQYVPNDIKFEALQSAILLLPDEHREVLLMLLEFLAQVADNAEHNQMSASNLSLCLAPSIFQNGVHSNTPNASPRRKKPTGLPDAKDLDENRASTECLTYMILNYKRIYQINSDKMNRCNFSYMEESRPVTLEALGDTVQLSNWRSYLYECVKATVKEGREKSRGWMTVNSHDPNIEIFCRKVGDGHPLKLWKCTTEIEATPMMILNRITKERHLWDKQLLKMRVIESLDANSDIFQYACSSGHTATDYCVLRSSNIDLPRGQCVTVEISIDHPAATTLLNAVRGVVLASRYLIEPCGNGKSKVMHLARVDTKGRTVEWYKNFGFLCALNLARIRDGLKNNSLE